jgi:hypothetical protein
MLTWAWKFKDRLDYVRLDHETAERLPTLRGMSAEDIRTGLAARRDLVPRF